MRLAVRVALAGMLAGGTNGALLQLHFPGLSAFTTPLFSGATALHGAWHGLWLAIGIWSASRWAETVGGTGGLRVFLGSLGAILGSLIGAAPFMFASFHEKLSLVEYVATWGLGFGLPVGFGITFFQAVSSRIQGAAKKFWNVFLTMMGGSFGGGFFWSIGLSGKWNFEALPIGLLHGAIFGLCFAIALYGEATKIGDGPPGNA